MSATRSVAPLLHRIPSITPRCVIPRVISANLAQRTHSTSAENSQHDHPPPQASAPFQPPEIKYVPITPLQRALYAIGSAFTALFDPYRGDMVAVLGETTGTHALRQIRDKMLQDPVGRRILREKPRVSTLTINMDRLRSLPSNTFGKVYVDWLDLHQVTPDTRYAVQFVEDPELAYVLQRYREVHDYWHALTGLGVTVEAELALKWFEMVQTGLPMTTLASLVGPLNLKAEERERLIKHYVPWALSSASQAKFLMNIYYEELFERDLVELQKELGITVSLPAPELGTK